MPASRGSGLLFPSSVQPWKQGRGYAAISADDDDRTGLLQAETQIEKPTAYKCIVFILRVVVIGTVLLAGGFAFAYMDRTHKEVVAIHAHLDATLIDGKTGSIHPPHRPPSLSNDRPPHPPHLPHPPHSLRPPSPPLKRMVLTSNRLAKAARQSPSPPNQKPTREATVEASDSARHVSTASTIGAVAAVAAVVSKAVPAIRGENATAVMAVSASQ